MTIEGFTNPAHILRAFIAHEYAFCYFIDNKEIRVAHHKGTWSFGKLRDNVSVDYFEWSDCFGDVRSNNDMTLAFVEEKRDQWIVKTPDGFDRHDEARAIEDALKVWAGSPEKITKLSVIQPGRNAMLDEETLDFVKSPREEEFHK